MRRPERRAIRVVALATALTLVLGVTTGTADERAAVAAPGAPSWDDVLDARGDVEATEIAISRIIDAVRGLEEQYAASAREALERGEQLQVARLALDEADMTLRTIERQRDAAVERSQTSARQAAQLMAQLARAGGGDITSTLLVSGDDADALLYRLATMNVLGVRADAVMALAERDRNEALALGEQAERALAARTTLATEAHAAADAAARAAEQAEARVAEQDAVLTTLSEQLATLSGRSAALEREYLAAVGGGPGDGSGGGGTGGAPPPNPSTPAPSPSAPNPAPTPSTPSPSPSSPVTGPSPSPSAPPPASVAAPNAAIVNAAIAFARNQLGKPYLFGGSGPNAWDCSGLTMMAYAAAGLAIGGHSVSAQYNRAATRGQLLPYAQALPGDLIFYSYGGSASGSKYHVTIYIGGGQMLEAPSPGKPVRIVTVRNFDRIPVVARPSAGM